jgi:hypothetical protein
MAVSVEMQHTGDPASQREVAAVIEHVLADRPGTDSQIGTPYLWGRYFVC